MAKRKESRKTSRYPIDGKTLRAAVDAKIFAHLILCTAKIEAPSKRAGSRKRPVKRSVRPRGAYATPLGFASNYAARSISFMAIPVGRRSI